MTQVFTESAQTVEEQAEAVTPNIQSENQAGIEIPAGSGEVAHETTEVAQVATEEAKAPSPTEEVNAIGDLGEYEAMKSRLQQDPNALADPNPAEEATPEEAKAPLGEVDPVATEGEAVNTEAEGAEKEEEAAKRESQFRLRPEEKLDAEAFRIFKAAQSAQAPVSMSDAISLARNHLGIQEPQLAQPQQSAAEDEEFATGEEAYDDDSVFEGITQESARDNLKELRKGQITAMRDGDLDEAADIGEQIIDAEELVEVLGSREAYAAQTAEVERTSQFEGSYTKAVDIYPDFAKEETSFFAKCKEIDQALETTDDPRYYEANKPLLVAQMAARELNIVPVVAGQAPASVAVQDPSKVTETSPQSTSPQPARTEKSAPLPAASGASRTGGSTGATTQDLQQKIANITSPAQFAALARQMGQVG